MRRWIWIAASADSMATFALGNSGNVRAESQLVNVAIGGDDLRVDMLRCTVHRQADRFELANLGATLTGAAQTILFFVQLHVPSLSDLLLCCLLFYCSISFDAYFFFASFSTTRSSA